MAGVIVLTDVLKAGWFARTSRAAQGEFLPGPYHLRRVLARRNPCRIKRAGQEKCRVLLDICLPADA